MLLVSFFKTKAQHNDYDEDEYGEVYLEPINDKSDEGQKIFVEELLDLAGYILDEIEIYQRLPNHAKVFRVKYDEKSKGGVLFAHETIDKQQVASQCGNVLAMGPDCYRDKDRFQEPWCKVGDWVIFARYAGSRIEIDGGEVRLLNDDEVLATVQDPTDILHKF